MRIAIISDVHSNLEALTQVIKKIKSVGYDELICLGDIIGYGPDPEPCLNIIFEEAKYIIKGNHETAVVTPEHLIRFDKYARESVLWTLENISEKYVRLLSYLREKLVYNGIQFVHSTPINPENWHYISNFRDAEEYFTYMHENVCFIGHSHIAGIYIEGLAKTLSPTKKAIINVGSVGQPRDGIKDASFGIFNTDTWIYTGYREKYDIKKTQDKILKTKLNPFLASRLAQGV
jgi:predicted phosphodiesterase